MPREAAEDKDENCIANKGEKLTKLSLERCVTVYNSIGHIRRERLNFFILYRVCCVAVVDGRRKESQETQSWDEKNQMGNC